MKTQKGRVIAVSNQKGGVAKTTSAINVATLLPDCLVVDLDPQGNLTTGLGVEVAKGQPTTYEVLTERIQIQNALVSTKSGVTLLPADITLAQGEPEILSKVGNYYLIKEALAPVMKDFQYVLIDCPPSLGLLTVNGLTAANLVLIPVQCQFFALKGLAALQETIRSVQKRINPELKILGVLPTMAEINTLMTQDVITSLEKRFTDTKVFKPVPKSVKFSESNVAGEPIHLYVTEPKLTEPYKAVAKFIMEGGM
jgi:chromosome partitioning protein